MPTEELIALAKKSIHTTGIQGKMETPLSEVRVCGCCLGSNSSDANEIVECDGCGISVHEVSNMNYILLSIYYTYQFCSEDYDYCNSPY